MITWCALGLINSSLGGILSLFVLRRSPPRSNLRRVAKVTLFGSAGLAFLYWKLLTLFE